MDKKIQKLSLYISNFYQKNTKCTDKFREELHFCLQYFIFNILVISTIIIVNTLFGLFKECIIVLATFCILRSSAGGFHCESYNKCYIISNLYILLFSYLAHILIPYYIPCSILAIVSILYIYFKYIPKPNEYDENLFITKEEKKKKFLKTVIMLISLLGTGLFLCLKLLVIGIACGMLSVFWITSDLGEQSFRFVQKYL